MLQTQDQQLKMQSILNELQVYLIGFVLLDVFFCVYSCLILHDIQDRKKNQLRIQFENKILQVWFYVQWIVRGLTKVLQAKLHGITNSAGALCMDNMESNVRDLFQHKLDNQTQKFESQRTFQLIIS